MQEEAWLASREPTSEALRTRITASSLSHGASELGWECREGFPFYPLV